MQPTTAKTQGSSQKEGGRICRLLWTHFALKRKFPPKGRDHNSSNLQII